MIIFPFFTSPDIDKPRSKLHNHRAPDNLSDRSILTSWVMAGDILGRNHWEIVNKNTQ